MATDRKLIQYLPSFMQEHKEMQEIMKAEQPEIDLLWIAAEGVFADQFILDATTNGVSRWESMIGISPKGTDTLEERKFRILSELNQELPYTFRKLEQVLTTLCGPDGYLVRLFAAEYRVSVRVALNNSSNYSEVKNIVNKMIPANMMCNVELMYTTHDELKVFTHGEMTAYTHEQLRNEALK